jgi:branched-chain amino acid transport system substrate-binding protein
MKKTYAIIIVLAIGVLGILYNNRVSTKEDISSIKIGTVLSQTGVAAVFGEQAKNGAILAQEEINSKGGINGRMITLVNEDDQTDPKTAVGLYKKLTSLDKVQAIIGGNFDFVANPLFAEAKTSGTVIISPTNSRIAGSLDTNENSFVMLSDLSDIVLTLDTYLTKTNYKKVEVLHYESGFGKEIAKTINAISVKNGKGEAAEDVYSTFGLKDWTPYILKMKKSGVDMVFADMLGSDFIHFATQARQLGLQAQLITHMDIANDIKVSKADLSPIENTTVLNWDALSGDEEFNKKFSARFGREANHFAAQSYIAVYAAAEAIAKSEGDRTKVAGLLASTEFKTPLGVFSFTKNHTAAKTKVKIQQIKNGKLVDLEIY